MLNKETKNLIIECFKAINCLLLSSLNDENINDFANRILLVAKSTDDRKFILLQALTFCPDMVKFLISNTNDDDAIAYINKLQVLL